MLNEIIEGIALFPDNREGKNKHYSIEDISLAAFSIFFTQSPSFLAFQKGMMESRGASNCQTIFNMTEIPSDAQIRNVLDSVPPEAIYPVFDKITAMMNKDGILDDFRCIKNDLLLILDGTQYFSSDKIHCSKCSQKVKDGKTTYSHSAITPALVTPRYRKALALAPEFIHKQDGTLKQDCERNAGKRWLARMGETLSPLGITLCGDDLYANQPFCEEVLEEDMNFLFVCKPKSHKWLYEWVGVNEKEGELHDFLREEKQGKKKLTSHYRYTKNVPLKDDDKALLVNWIEVTITDDMGKQIYHNAFVTNHTIDDETMAIEIVNAGRARWKIENENNNTLKTKGYHLEHNFGHGKNNLSETLASLNILAFLFHSLMELSDKQYQLIRKTLPRRDMFFDDIRALTRYFCFDDWKHLMTTMLQGLKLEDPG
ncbi:MAG: ISNCY family transposase [bacterium]|nr:ISNCY family transposase [bacterium]